MAQLNDLIVTGNSRFINKTYTSTVDVGCITASSAAGVTEHSAGTTGQALVSDGDSVYWGDPQHANTTDEAQHATSAATLDDTEFIEDNEPYLFRTAPREAWDRVYEDAIVGGSVAWNQLLPKDYMSTATPVNCTRSYEDGVLKMTATADNVSQAFYKASPSFLTTNNIYFFGFEIKTDSSNEVWVNVGMNSSSGTTDRFFRIEGVPSNFTFYSGIQKLGSATQQGLRFGTVGSMSLATGGMLYFKDIELCDLTLMFGSTIADYIYTLEQSEAGSGIAWLKSYGFFTKDYYAYNAGGIQSVKTSAKKVVGFNQWDEQWELGSIDTTTGENISGSSSIRSKNYIRIIGGQTYYILKSGLNVGLRWYDKDKNYTGYTSASTASTTLTRAKDCYLRFVTNSTTIYKPDTAPICINLHWDGERDGEYEAYEEHTYPLDSDLELRGIPKLDSANKLYYDGDTYASDGTVTRKYGIVDLGSVSWSYDSTNECFASVGIKGNRNGTPFISTLYIDQGAVAVSQLVTLGGTLRSNALYLKNASYTDATTFKTAMSGVYLVYELATATSESADSYQNPQIVSNWGTEEFVDERDVPVPVGHDSRYPKTDNYKLATIPAPPGRAGDYIVHTDEYGESVYQQASDVKVNYAGTADLGKRRIFIQGSQTAPTTGGAWTGDASAYFQSSADLTDGQEITYWVPLATTGNVTLNLQFGDGTSSGAVNCYYGGTSRLTTHYGQGQAIHLTYRKNVKIPSTGSTAYTGWWADANYYSDSNTISSLRGDYTYLVAGTNVGVQNNSLIARDSNGKYSSFTSNSTTAVSKVANRTDYFDISKIFYYSGSVAAGGNMASGALYWAVASLNSRYTINASNLTVRKPLYLKFDANESTVSSITGATCYKLGGTANDDYWSQDLPASADGMIYVEVSRGVRDYRVDLAEDQHFYQYTDKLHEYDSWSVGYATSASDAITAKYSDGAIVFEEEVEDDTGDGTIALLNFNNVGVREWNTPSTTSGLIYMSDKYSPCIRRYKDGKMLYVDSGVVDVSLMQNITLTPNKIVYMDLQSYNTYTTIAANWAISASPFTQTVSSSNQMIMGIALDSTHFYLFPENKIKDKLGHSGHAFGTYSHVANSLDVDSQIGGGTSAVYFTSAGKPAAINIATVTVNNATNAAKVNGTAFGSLSTVSTITSGMLPSHAHTTADITSFNSAVDARITRDAVLSKISSSGVYTGDYSVAEGYKTTASGKYSHAEGDRTTATTTAAHAEGCLTTASGKYAHAEGYYTKASATAAHAEGYIAYATDDYAHAEGKDTLADAEAAHVEGELSTASGLAAHAEGYHCLASGDDSHASGFYTTASGDTAYAEGGYSVASGDYSHAEGGATTASGAMSHASGNQTIANANYQTAIGLFNSTVADALFIIGNGMTTADRSNALYVTTASNVAIGSGHVIDIRNSIAAGSSCYVTTVTGIATTGANSFAWGNACTAVGDCSWAEGSETRANQYAHAEGDSTYATGEASHSEGASSLARGICSHAEGVSTAYGDYSHSEGNMTYTATACGHAEGYATTASGTSASHAEGYKTLASGKMSHAEGNLTTASGAVGHAEGIETFSNGTSASHAEGYGTTATGPWTHAEGYYTSASERSSHAEGYQTTAIGAFSHAGGYFTIANKSGQTAIGQCNSTVSNALFIVGNGSADDARSNAMYVTTAGDINCVSLTQTSDERTKKDIKNLTTTDAALFNSLTPKSYTLNAEQNVKQHYGFIAQDIVEAAAEIGMPTSALGMVQQEDSEEAYYSLNYSEIVPLLVQKVKELEQRIAALEQR